MWHRPSHGDAEGRIDANEVVRADRPRTAGRGGNRIDVREAGVGERRKRPLPRVDRGDRAAVTARDPEQPSRGDHPVGSARHGDNRNRCPRRLIERNERVRNHANRAGVPAGVKTANPATVPAAITSSATRHGRRRRPRPTFERASAGS